MKFEMTVVKMRKRFLSTYLIFLLYVTICYADQGVNVSYDRLAEDGVDRPAPSGQDKGDTIESAEPSNIDEKKQVQAEAAQPPQDLVETKQQNEQSQSDNSDQPSNESEDKKEETKTEDAENSPSVNLEKHNSKQDENMRKINLNDVNTYMAKDDYLNNVKRETSYSEFSNLPRDYSYFFDDLEPFIYNNSDNRVSRAASSRENKNQRSKVSGGRERENIDVDADDEEEECANDEDEEEKSNEDDYDESEDVDSDCKPTVNECTTSPECTPSTSQLPTTTCQPPTTACPPHTTTCAPPTTTCAPPTTTCAPPTSAKVQCITTCRSAQSSTKCPHICVKANRKRIGLTLTPEPMINWDADKKRINDKKRRYRSKANSSK